MAVSIEDLVRPCVREIVSYSPGRSMPHAVKLASNENPFGPSALAIGAMQRALSDVRLYPDMHAVDLTQALADHVELEFDNVIVGRGSDEVIHMLGLTFLTPEDEIIFPDPPFALYPFTAQVTGCTAVPIPMADWQQDIEATIAAITPRTRLIFLASPNNPTGTIVTRDEAARLIEALPDHTILAMDEAYFEYCSSAEYPDMRDYITEGRKVICLRTFSKIYALAGLRVGYGLAPKPMVEALRKVREPFNVGNLSLLAAEASLRDAEQVRRTVEINDQAKALFYREFERLGLEYVESWANFVFVNCGIHSKTMFDRLLERGFTVRTGDIWGPKTETWLRVTTGTMDQCQAFIEALEASLAEG
jgi:histidinol-phosphate aminotransferase